MHFTKKFLQQTAQELLSAPTVEEQSIGENIALEQNVPSVRQNDFENFAKDDEDVCHALNAYFAESVQGQLLTHRPSTFDPTLNEAALWPASIEPNQKILRLERIDGLLSKAGLDFLQVEQAVRDRNYSYLQKLADLFDQFPGQRPAFAAFRSEIADDLKNTDWLSRLIDRLGLYHHYPYHASLTYHFVLAEYLVADVLAQAKAKSLERPFATATLLECQNNPAFYPAPPGASVGFAVDLRRGTPPRASVREFLHCRIRYQPQHFVRAAAWSGNSPPNLLDARHQHQLFLSPVR